MKEVLDTPKLYIEAANSNSKQLVGVVKGSDHPLTRPEWREEYFQMIISWIKEKL